MKTEITEMEQRGWIFYDGRCVVCRRQVERWGAAFARRGYECVPQQTPWAQGRLGLRDGKTATEMKVLTKEGGLRGGLDAVLFLMALVPWCRPLVWVARVPGLFHLLNFAYMQIAKRRYCFGGYCEVDL